jgi:hypothetical protein
LTLEEKEAKASKISTEKIFSQEDFKKIRLEQLKKKISDKNFVKNKSKMLKIDLDEDENSDEEANKRFVFSIYILIKFFFLFNISKHQF